MNDKLKADFYPTGLGMAAGGAVYIGGTYVSAKIFGNALRHLRPDNIPNDIHKKLNAGCKDMFVKEGFKAEGIQIADISTKNGKDIINEESYKKLKCIKERMNKAGYFEKAYLRKKLKRTLLAVQFENKEVLKGKNASFNWGIGNKKVYINTKNGMHMFPHELGHALNHRILGKCGQRIVYGVLRNRKVSGNMLRLTLLTSLLVNNKKERKNNDSSNIIIRGIHFIKDHCGKLAFLALTPLVIEEGMASVNGQRMSKKYFDKDIMKIITKSHLHSFASYLRFPVTAAISMYAANIVRDIAYKKIKED